jgi:hypothetical protein
MAAGGRVKATWPIHRRTAKLTVVRIGVMFVGSGWTVRTTGTEHRAAAVTTPAHGPPPKFDGCRVGYLSAAHRLIPSNSTARAQPHAGVATGFTAPVAYGSMSGCPGKCRQLLPRHVTVYLECGHSVAPPRSVTNSRRPMGFTPHAGAHITTPLRQNAQCASQQIWVSIGSFGSFASKTIRAGRRSMSAAPQKLT